MDSNLDFFKNGSSFFFALPMRTEFCFSQSVHEVIKAVVVPEIF